MIIKYIVENPDHHDEQNDGLNRIAFEYIDNVESVMTFETKDGYGKIHNCVAIERKDGFGFRILVDDELYIMNDEGKTLRVIRPYVSSDVLNAKYTDAKVEEFPPIDK